VEKYIEVMRRIVELAETFEEGVIHIRNKVNEGMLEVTTFLMQDVVSAFAVIEKAVWTYDQNLVLNPELEKAFKDLRNGLSTLIDSFEQANGGKILEILQFNILPASKKWKAELEIAFSSYLLS
jgi:DNA replication protein DnaD